MYYVVCSAADKQCKVSFHNFTHHVTFQSLPNIPLPSIQTARSHAYMHILSQAQQSDQHQLVPKTVSMRLENAIITKVKK